MNRYENVLLEKMVELHEFAEDASSQPEIQNKCTFAIHVLLDCVKGFREPPKGLSLEDGFGAMVAEGGEVV